MKNSTRYSAWQCGKHERKGISHLGPNIYIYVGAIIQLGQEAHFHC